jgi:hypothetical protein
MYRDNVICTENRRPADENGGEKLRLAKPDKETDMSALGHARGCWRGKTNGTSCVPLFIGRIVTTACGG